MTRHTATALVAAGSLALALGFAGARAQAPAPDGAAIFADNCAACHQPHGEGIEGAFPKLAGDTFAQGPAPQVAALLIHGRGGMPSFASDLDDAKIAAVLTFVRGAWGNKAAPIDVATVAAARKGTAKEDSSVLPYH